MPWPKPTWTLKQMGSGVRAVGALRLAASTGYPLLDVFLTILGVFLFVAWIFVLVMVILDLVRSDDLSGWGKAGWLLPSSSSRSLVCSPT